MVATEASERSVGSQETFAKDTDDLEAVATELLRISARVASRMRQAKVVGRTVTLKAPSTPRRGLVPIPVTRSAS